jgi:hypothetical protein
MLRKHVLFTCVKNVEVGYLEFWDDRPSYRNEGNGKNFNKENPVLQL